MEQKAPKQQAQWVEKICPICGKRFIPAAMHIFKDAKKIYCGWNCFCKRTDLKGAKKRKVLISDVHGNVYGEFTVSKAADFINCSTTAVRENAKNHTLIFHKYIVRYTDEME